MLIAVAIACLVMTAGARGGPGIPGRLQSAAELAYEFIAGMLRSAAGEKGMRFFPFVFCLFMFILIWGISMVMRSGVISLRTQLMSISEARLPSGMPSLYLPDRIP